jgi:hypothetical protein
VGVLQGMVSRLQMINKRFDSEQYLEDFKKSKKYPKIHDAIFFPASQWSGEVVGDLCSSTGLLGHRFKELAGATVKALEPDKTAIQLGTAYGIYGAELPVTPLKITVETLPQLASWMEGVNTLIARRCLAELSLSVQLQDLYDLIFLAGVKVVALEGNNQSVKSTHPFGQVDTQAKFFSGGYSVVYSEKNVRVLKRRG